MASVFMTLPAFGGVGAYLDGKLLATHGSKVHTEIAYTLLRIGQRPIELRVDTHNDVRRRACGRDRALPLRGIVTGKLCRLRHRGDFRRCSPAPRSSLPVLSVGPREYEAEQQQE